MAADNTDSPAVGTSRLPDLFWGNHTMVGDLSEDRYFLSPGGAYRRRQLLVGTLGMVDNPNGMSVVSLNHHAVTADTVVALPMQHGDQFPMELKIGDTRRQFTVIVTPLPVFAIEAEKIVDEPKLPGRYQWIDGNAQKRNGWQNLAIELRGVTAQVFPKKPYAIEFRKDKKPKKSRNVQLLNLRTDDDWIADAAYRDLSFARNLVSHDIYRAMRPQAFVHLDKPYGQATIAGSFAEIILNGHYHGLYVIHERMDRKLLDLRKVSVPRDASRARWDQVDFDLPQNGSVLFKAQSTTAGFYRPEQIRQDFEQKYPDLQDADRYDQLESLFRFVHDTSGWTFSQQVGEIIDLPSVVDMWLLRLLTANTDTLGKNYYLARNQTGKWFFQPWDYDATFGVDWRGGEAYHQTIEFFRPEQNLLIRRLWRIPQTGFNELARKRWMQLRQSLFTVDAIVARFDAYHDLIGADTSGDDEHPRNRNLRRWPASGNRGAGSHAPGNSAYIASWLTERLAFLDKKIAALPLE
jgi:hypothetical protein